jgi:hypothetical protein
MRVQSFEASAGGDKWVTSIISSIIFKVKYKTNTKKIVLI